MRRNIFIDLDGTLIDARHRLFRLFSDITLQNLLDFEDYWELKKAMYSNEWILTNYFYYSESQIDNFKSVWLEKIETDQYLAYDNLFPETVPFLTKASETHELYLLTSRQFAEKAEQQLKEMGIFNFFKKILVTAQRSGKTELIRKSNIQINNDDILIGDTGIDIQTAKEVGMRSMAVLTGCRSRSILKKYSPDHIMNNLEGSSAFI